MKLLILTLCILGASTGHSEVLRVYQAKKEGMHLYSGGQLLGEINTGKASLKEIINKKRNQSWTKEPFYGPVTPCILQDTKGNLYIAHLEDSTKIPQLDKPLRAAMNNLWKEKSYLKGNPYKGSSIYSPEVISQLSEILMPKEAEPAESLNGEAAPHH